LERGENGVSQPVEAGKLKISKPSKVWTRCPSRVIQGGVRAHGYGVGAAALRVEKKRGRRSGRINVRGKNRPTNSKHESAEPAFAHMEKIGFYFTIGSSDLGGQPFKGYEFTIATGAQWADSAGDRKMLKGGELIAKGESQRDRENSVEITKGAKNCS